MFCTFLHKGETGNLLVLAMYYLLVKATDRFAKRKVLFLSLSNFIFLKSGPEVIVCVIS